MPNTTDEQLHAAWRRGDRSAGARLIDRYIVPMKRFFANKVGELHDMEDLVATTFERCARGLDAFHGSSSFRTYLYGIAKNVLREYVRKKTRREGELDFEEVAARDLGPSPSAVLVEKAEQRLLLEALRVIPLDYQIVLEMAFFENRTAADISKTLDLPMGTVSSRIRRGKMRLQEALEEIADSAESLNSTMHGLDGWVKSIQERLAEKLEAVGA